MEKKNHIFVKKSKKKGDLGAKMFFLVGNSTKVIKLSVQINLTMMEKRKTSKMTTACDHYDSP